MKYLQKIKKLNKKYVVMKQLFIMILVACSGVTLFAQQTFIAKGKIEFEKKENLHKMIDMQAQDWDYGDASWLDDVKKNTPQFAVYYYDLMFSDTKTLYKPGRETPDQKSDMWGQSPSQDIVVFSDLPNGTLVSQKTIFGSQFLIQDSSRKIEWRITNDTREIAGFTCRKAVGKILDSVYVIAFYTDQIVTTGGPESFNGLPGMILGIAIPRINTTWFATKLELTPVTDANLPVPTKGKKQTVAAFTKSLQELMKDSKNSGKRMMIQALI